MEIMNSMMLYANYFVLLGGMTYIIYHNYRSGAPSLSICIFIYTVLCLVWARTSPQNYFMEIYPLLLAIPFVLVPCKKFSDLLRTHYPELRADIARRVMKSIVIRAVSMALAGYGVGAGFCKAVPHFLGEFQFTTIADEPVIRSFFGVALMMPAIWFLIIRPEEFRMRN